MFGRTKKSKVPVREGRWSAEEHQRFLQGMMIYGRRWTKVADIVGTRNTVQVRSHAQKYEMKMDKHSGAAQCAGGEGSNAHDLDATATWTSVAEPPAAQGVSHVQHNAPMAFGAQGQHPGHQLQNNYLEESIMQPEMMRQQMGSPTTGQNIGSPEEEMAQWAELAVGAPQSQVGDMMHYKAWNELPTTNAHMSGGGGQALPHQIDTSYDSYGAMIMVSSPCASKPSTPTSSEDEFMTYLDSNIKDMAMGDDMMAMNMGASDLAPPPMFPSFPSGDEYNGGW